MRASGILMHISSLPSDYGIGTLGREARKFVDFWKRQVRRIGRFFQFVRPVMGILRTSPFQVLQAIHILLI